MLVILQAYIVTEAVRPIQTPLLCTRHHLPAVTPEDGQVEPLMSSAPNMPMFLEVEIPKGPSTQYFGTSVPKTINRMVFGTRNRKYWVLGPSGNGMQDPHDPWAKPLAKPNISMSRPLQAQSPHASPLYSLLPLQPVWPQRPHGTLRGVARQAMQGPAPV